MEEIKELLKTKFNEYFGFAPNKYFLSPGRLEIVGNHTDHNNGLALVAGASMYVKAAVSTRNDDMIRLFSEGHDLYEVKVMSNKPDPRAFTTTNALIAGIVNGFLIRGYKAGGFNAYVMSDVLEGSGVSSSAAFELLICSILNTLYNNSDVPTVEMVKIAQEAESKFFGKPCGLLDQIGSAFGGISFVDFMDSANPEVNNTSFPFDLKIVLTNPGGSHVGLTDYYASIPHDMKKVAEILGGKVLRTIKEEDFINFVKNYPSVLSEMEKNRTLHYFAECKRVSDAYNAINNKDVGAFIKAVNDSGFSSSNLLCNTQVPGRYENSPEKALRLAREVAPNSGHRVHGGGFMGTIISFVRNEEYGMFLKKMKAAYGENNVMEVSISPFGSKAI